MLERGGTAEIWENTLSEWWVDTFLSSAANG
jgi:hypothetical protein